MSLSSIGHALVGTFFSFSSLNASLGRDLEQRHDAFIAKFGIKVIPGQDSQVVVAIPVDTTYLQFLQEAQKLSIELHHANPNKYKSPQAISLEFLHNLEFVCDRPNSEFKDYISYNQKGDGISVLSDGCFPGSNGKGMDRQRREALLAKNGFATELSRELVVAHAARYLFDGKSIFKGKIVSVNPHELNFNHGVYACVSWGNTNGADIIAQSARILPPIK